MYRSGICVKSATSLERSTLEPKLLQSVYTKLYAAYRLDPVT